MCWSTAPTSKRWLVSGDPDRRRGYRFSRLAEGTPSVTVATGETPLASQQRQMNP
jgi:hypothetical protein